jgi:polyketide cyclase/dehydrase/lipid transport protein
VKPVTATVTVPQAREDVYDFLDVLANHRSFNDHFLVDWELSGPEAGVGARARMRAKTPGPDDWLDLEVKAAERPRMTAEESVGAKGRRRTRGTYLLEELPDGGTRITFELVWLEAPLSERLMAPITRAVVGRANAKALRRLVGVLAERGEEEAR